VSTYDRVVAADENASLAPTVRARLATEMADPTSDVGASLSSTFVAHDGVWDIIVAAGQSNATRRSSVPTPVHESDSRYARWDSATSQIVEADFTEVPWIGSGFADQWLTDHPTRRLLVVEAAVGSTGFTSTSLDTIPAGYHASANGTWERTLITDPLNLYAAMTAKTTAALTAAGAGSQIVAVLWSQGEEDAATSADGTTYPAGMSQAQYAAKLDDLIAQTRTDLGISDLPFVIGSMTPEHVEYSASTNSTYGIQMALIDTPRRVLSTSFLMGPKNMTEYPYRVHWTPQGQEIRGRDMAKNGVLRAQLNLATANPMPPVNLKATRLGSGAVELTWDFPECQVTQFTVRYSTDGGASYAYVTPLDSIVDTKLLVSVPTGESLIANVRTVNTVGTSPYCFPVVAHSVDVAHVDIPARPTRRFTTKGATGTSGDAVTIWSPNEPGVSLTRDYGATNPTLVVDGDGKRYSFTGGSLGVASAPGKTVVMVARVTTGATGLQAFATQGAPRMYWLSSGTPRVKIETGGPVNPEIALAANAWAVVVWVIDGANVTLRINGTETTITNGTHLPVEFFVGRVSSTLATQVEIAEVIEYRRALSAAERADAYTSLKAVYSGFSIA